MVRTSNISLWGDIIPSIMPFLGPLSFWALPPFSCSEGLCETVLSPICLGTLSHFQPAAALPHGVRCQAQCGLILGSTGTILDVLSSPKPTAPGPSCLAFLLYRSSCPERVFRSATLPSRTCLLSEPSSSLLCVTDVIHRPFMGQKPHGLSFMVVVMLDRRKKY